MSVVTIAGDKIILPGGVFCGYITAKDGVIQAISKNRPKECGRLIDATGLYVSAGFIDIHTHGGGGSDFMDGTADCIANGVLAHLKHGTTTIIPTTLASIPDEVFAFLDNFHKVQHELVDGPYMHGVHLEGPYFNPAMAGAQDPKYIKPPCPEEYKKIIDYAKGVIVRWSLAPELDGSIEMGDYLFSHGIIPSIAHSNAEYIEVEEAFNHHFNLITHFYSCISGLMRRNSYRFLGVIESGYLIDDMDVEIIADGHHLPPELLKLIYKIKGPDRIALCTDSMRAAGTSDTESIIGSLKNGQKVIVEDGVAKMPCRTSFAGSVATADLLVRTMHTKADVDIINSIKMMTTTPARILGLKNKGAIAVGMDCDLAIFDSDINIKSVIMDGKEVL